jgi:hypothetical protein
MVANLHAWSFADWTSDSLQLHTPIEVAVSYPEPFWICLVSFRVGPFGFDSSKSAPPTIQLFFECRRTLEAHNPPFGQHQVLACPGVSTPALALVLHAELPKAADQDILAALKGLLDDLKGDLDGFGA